MENELPQIALYLSAEKGLAQAHLAWVCMSAYRRREKVFTDRGCYCASLAPNFIRLFRLICQRLLHVTRTVWIELCFGC